MQVEVETVNKSLKIFTFLVFYGVLIVHSMLVNYCRMSINKGLEINILFGVTTGCILS